MSDKENFSRPKFTVRPSRRDARRTIRHHHPGTRRRPPTPRVRVLSSIILVPPNDLPVPTVPTAPPHEELANEPSCFEPPQVPIEPWKTPSDLEEPPMITPQRRTPDFIPEPQVDYSEGFQIIPGEAYGAVPLYVDRDQPWRLTPVDVPPTRRVHFYRNDIRDPRMYDFRVEVTPHTEEPPEQNLGLFEPPHRPSLDRPGPSSDVVSNLIALLDKTYGCPRPKSSPPTEIPPREPRIPSPAPQPPSQEDSSITDSLRILLRIARLFEGPPPDSATARRWYKRPNQSKKR